MNDNESIGMIYNKKAATENKTNWIGEELARKFHNVSMLVQFLFFLSLSIDCAIRFIQPIVFRIENSRRMTWQSVAERAE